MRYTRHANERNSRNGWHANVNFLERIFASLHEHRDRVVLQEAWDDRTERASAAQLLAHVARARGFLRASGLQRGERCAVVASNSIRWAALDLAIMAEGIIKVPMYTRQAPEELVKMMQDCSASLVLCGDATLRDGVRRHWPDAPPVQVLDEVFGEGAGDTAVPGGSAPGESTSGRRTSGRSAPGGDGSDAGQHTRPVAVDEPPKARTSDDPVAILYTSGTSGVSKGVVLTVGNLDHMLPCTLQRLEDLMRSFHAQERVFHYLPFCFAGSWILLLSSLTRCSLLTLATSLEGLPQQMAVAQPHYFLNVPMLLDRMREGIDAKLRATPLRGLYARACRAWERRQERRPAPLDGLWLGLANAILFRAVRKKISPNLMAFICGSAPLSEQTQLFFEMLGIPVLQVYGLTETTAICTMDLPHGARRPGYVGHAISGVEMKLGEGDEILVRGANIFPGYWERPEETAACLRDGWFLTGDQGAVDENGNWRIIGRVKNLIVLSSGHNVAPDPIEERLRQAVPGAQQVVVVGHQRKHLTAIVTGSVTDSDVRAAIDALNPSLPHYQRVRAHHIQEEPFSIENGFLTANGKLKRKLVLERLEPEIEHMYSGSAV